MAKKKLLMWATEILFFVAGYGMARGISGGIQNFAKSESIPCPYFLAFIVAVILVLGFAFISAADFAVWCDWKDEQKGEG